MAAKALTARNSQRIFRRSGSLSGIGRRPSPARTKSGVARPAASGLSGLMVNRTLAKPRASEWRVSLPLRIVGYQRGGSPRHALRHLLLLERGDEFRLRPDAERDPRAGRIRALFDGAIGLHHARRRHTRLAALFDAALFRRR